LVVALVVAPASAAPCSSDTFSIDGSSVSLNVCPSGAAAAGKLPLTETASVKGQPPLGRVSSIDLIPGSDVARTIDDLPLRNLGIARTLHLTISYKNGAVRVEHALLVPGAIALK